MKYTFLVFLFASVLAFSRYTVYNKGHTEIKTCHTILYKSAKFCHNQQRKDYICYCHSRNALASLAGCAKYLEPDLRHFQEYLVKYCTARGFAFTSLTVKASLEYLDEFRKKTASNHTNLKLNSSFQVHPSLHTGVVDPHLNTREITKADFVIIDYPIFVNSSSVKRYYSAYSSLHANYNWSFWFSDLLYAYWGLVLLCAAARNWGISVFPRLLNVFNGRISKSWQKYVTTPALIGKKRARHQACCTVFDFLVPTRLESLTLFIFFALTLAFNVLCMEWNAKGSVFVTNFDKILRLVGDRTGIIGTMLLPLLLLVGGRNNILQWLTKRKFSTFLVYHRWIGRMIVILILVHSLAYGAIFVRENRLPITMKKEPAMYGTLGSAAGVLVIFQGILFVRRKMYEVFLVIHVLMAFAFMWGTWVHLKSRMFMEWVFAACAVWAFEKILRIIRMVSFGTPNASLILLPDECVRVTVPKPRYWKSVPGGHAWVYFWHSWYFWQSHPFTFFDSLDKENHIVFLIKAKTGATKRISDYLKQCSQESANLRVCIEGPYGESCSVKHHDNVIFVAGGNGIPGMLSESVSLAKSSQGSRQRIKLIWAIRDYSTIRWIWQELQYLRGTKIEVTIYITRSEGNICEEIFDADIACSDKKVEFEGPNAILDYPHDTLSHVNFIYGRPSMDKIVEVETDNAVDSAAFITCGHPAMVDDLRYAVVQKIDRTEKRVDFYEQLQVWA